MNKSMHKGLIVTAGVLLACTMAATAGTWTGETAAFRADARAGHGAREPRESEWATWDTAWDGAASVEVTLERPGGRTEWLGGGSSTSAGRGSAVWRPGEGESGTFTLTHVSRDASGREIGRLTAEFFRELAAVETSGTPVPVPFAWLEAHPDYLAAFGGDYEAAAAGRAANGMAGWQCYMAGVEPTDPDAALRTLMEIRDGEPSLKPDPDLKAERVYGLQGRKSLAEGDWEESPGLDGWRGKDWRFFRITVKMPE